MIKKYYAFSDNMHTEDTTPDATNTQASTNIDLGDDPSLLDGMKPMSYETRFAWAKYFKEMGYTAEDIKPLISSLR
jgi:hypothetical protein